MDRVELRQDELAVLVVQIFPLVLQGELALACVSLEKVVDLDLSIPKIMPLF